MKKLIYAGFACLMLLAVQACSEMHKNPLLMKLLKKLFCNLLQTLCMTKS